MPAPPGFEVAGRPGPLVADVDLGTYFRGTPSGGLLVGGAEPECDPLEWLEDPDDYNPSVTRSIYEAQVYRAARRLPELGVPSTPRGIAAVYDVADDWIPIYDKTALPGFYVAIGTSGNQFKNAPLVGALSAGDHRHLRVGGRSRRDSGQLPPTADRHRPGPVGVQSATSAQLGQQQHGHGLSGSPVSPIPPAHVAPTGATVKQTHYRAVVIGGGVVGASVLYHLAKLGWSDLLLIERSELTAGSTWHAAAGFHTLNGDPNVAALQKYTIDLYPELEAETGQSCGLHMTGGINLAGTPERWEWLQSQWAVFQTIGNETVRLVEPDEIKELCPIVDIDGIYGGMYDTYEGHLDASGTTHAYAAAARKRGAEVVLHNRVVELHQRPGGWSVVTEHGTITADHVVNAGGLWARNVGRMAGVDLPVAPLEHHYLVTETIPEVAGHDGELPMMMDLEGFTYLRQEGQGLLLGVYELDPKHWHVDGAPWDFGMRLLPPDIDRIGPELEIGLSRFPCLETAGIKKWVNGAFTFTPDGNPLVGTGRRAARVLGGVWSDGGIQPGRRRGAGAGAVDGERRAGT